MYSSTHTKSQLRRRDLPRNGKSNGGDYSNQQHSSSEEEVDKPRHRYNKHLSTLQRLQNNNNNKSNNSPMTIPEALIAATEAPLPNTNRSSTAKRSLSESSADEIHKNNMNCPDSGNSRRMWRNELVMNPGSAESQPKRKHSGAGAALLFGHPVTSDVIDVGIRVILVCVFIKLETTHAFKRKIQMEELWHYKNPRTADIVTPVALLVAVILGPFFTTLALLAWTRDRRDFRAASWVWTLTLCFNGLVTSLLKITVGRPRPDFFYRCFPDGVMVLNNVTDATHAGAFELFNCTGSVHDINEGRKSFPSGHASFAFTSFGFIALYLAGKLHALSPLGRGQTWRLCVFIAPLVLAALIAVSRTCDYHHHWQDVLVGSLIGFFVAYAVYRQYYPSVFARNSHRAYPRGSHARNSNAYRRLPAAAVCGAGDVISRATAIDDRIESDECDEDDLAVGSKDEYRPLICADEE